MVQWLGLCALTAEGPGSTPDPETKISPVAAQPKNIYIYQSRLIQKLHSITKDSLGFFTSLHCPSSVNPCSSCGAERMAIIAGITSGHGNVQREKGNLERRLRALSLESNSFGS